MAEERRELRKQIYSGINSEHQQCTDEWLVQKWPDFFEQLFQRRKQEPDKAMALLKRMIETRATPTYKYNAIATGETSEFIPPRSLSNEELDTLNKLLPIYEAKLNDI